MLAGDAVSVAPLLLGAVLDGRGVSVRLTEVEAYLGVGEDPGSHAFRGQTPRTAPMFAAPGTLYVYLSYGMHRCLNLVTGEAGTASAVLVRAGEVVAGIDEARARALAGRRPGADGAVPRVPDRDLARGPARLARALGVTLDDDGRMLADGAVDLAASPGPAPAIATGPRVGVAHPGGGDAYPWRFWIPGDPTVSAYRPGRGITRAR
ncbi:DNA-3-methyladenine glycosylase [Microcella alkaliphila]|nr:DNA-3-methyladenine glycosylase [Microcella alkaliphila]